MRTRWFLGTLLFLTGCNQVQGDKPYNRYRYEIVQDARYYYVDDVSFLGNCVQFRLSDGTSESVCGNYSIRDKGTGVLN